MTIQLQNAAKELKITKAKTTEAVAQIEGIRKTMKQKQFVRFEEYLEGFGQTAFMHFIKSGQSPAAAEKNTRELTNIVRQARWINMRAGIERAAKETREKNKRRKN